MREKRKIGIYKVLIFILILGITTGLGFFTAYKTAQSATSAANLDIQLIDTDGIVLDLERATENFIYQGEGRSIAYTIKNAGNAAATVENTLTFSFTDGIDNGISLSASSLPVQLYNSSDVTVDATTSEYIIRTGAVPIAYSSVSGNRIVYSFTNNLDGNHELDEYVESDSGTDHSSKSFVLVFDNDCESADDFAEANISLTISTSAKVYDRWLSAWASLDTASAAAVMNVRGGLNYIASVYNTSGTLIGSYTTLSAAFDAAAATAETDAATMLSLYNSAHFGNYSPYFAYAAAPGYENVTYSDGTTGLTASRNLNTCVNVRVELLKDCSISSPISITTPYCITLTSNADALEEEEKSTFRITSRASSHSFAVADVSGFALDNVIIDANGNTANIIRNNGGELFTTGNTVLCNSHAPAINNAGVLRTNGLKIYDCEADVGAAIYSSGNILFEGINTITENETAGGLNSNVYLATASSYIYTGRNFSLLSRIGVASVYAFDKTMVYTLDSDRYTSDYAVSFIFDREDIWDPGYKARYYGSEFYVSDEFSYGFNDSNHTYYVNPAGNNVSMPRLGDFSGYILSDGTPCSEGDAGAYKLSFPLISGNRGSLSHTACLREIWIDEDVSSLCVSSFAYMSKLKYVVGLENAAVANIPEKTFAGCNSLVDVALPNITTSVGAEVFFGCSSLTEIEIPATVTTVGNSLFYNCTALRKVYWNTTSLSTITFANNVANVFYGCSNLKHFTTEDIDNAIIVPTTLTTVPAYMCRGAASLEDINLAATSVTTIGSSAFANCTSLVDVDFSTGLTTLEAAAFQGCTTLPNINLPNTLTRLYADVFRDCTSITEVTVPQSLTYMSISVFRNCSSLNKVYWNANRLSSITTIPAGRAGEINIFSGCTNLHYVSTVDDDHTIIIPTTMNRLPGYLFHACESITEVDISGTAVTTIEPYLFQYCTSLTNISLPNAVSTLGISAFDGCSSLEEFTVTSNVSAVGNYLFQNCLSLNKVYWQTTSIATTGTQIFKGCTNLKYCTADDIDHAVIVNPSITVFPSSMFYSCTSLTDVDLTSTSVTSIGVSSFYGCSGLESVALPNTLTTINQSAFQNCSSLVDITMPNSLLTIGQYTFRGCSSLEEITIPSNVLSFGRDSFKDCSNLSKVYWNTDRVVSTGSYDGVFYGCTNLWYLTTEDTDNAVVVPTTWTHVPAQMFYASKIREVRLENTAITYIGAEAFYGCTSLTSVSLPAATLTTVNDYAFLGCTALTQITVPENVSTIGRDIFRNCSNLAKVYWNTDNVSTVGFYSGMFNGCLKLQYMDTDDIDNAIVVSITLTHIPQYMCDGSRLKEVRLGNTAVTLIDNYAFEGCTLLTYVLLPDQAVTIGTGAFPNGKTINYLSSTPPVNNSGRTLTFVPGP